MSTISGYSSSYSQSMEALKERTFKKADSSGDGSIDSSEFADFLSKGPNGSSMDAESTFASFDTDGDGVLSADEMDKGMQSLHSQMESTMNQMRFSGGGKGGGMGMGTPPSIDELFSKADSDSSSGISSDEFAEFLSKGPQSSSVNAEEAFASYDTDGDGTLSSDEFSTGMQEMMASMMPPPPPPSGTQGGMGSNDSSSSSDSIMSLLDSDGDGVVDSNELTTALSNTEIQKKIAAYMRQMGTSYSSDQTSSLLTSLSA